MEIKMDDKNQIIKLENIENRIFKVTKCDLRTGEGKAS
jgi:hypothetical protein